MDLNGICISIYSASRNNSLVSLVYFFTQFKMAYYSSGGNDSSRFLSTLIVIGIIGLVSLCSNLKENSQKSLINRARNATTEYSQEEKYEAYLKKYPNGKYANEAASFIVNYYGDQPLQKSSSLYPSTISNLSRLESVRDNFPGSFLERRMDSLINAKVNIEYQKALNSETIEGWRLYKTLVSEEYWRDADQRMEDINSRLWGTEDQAWKTAQKQNTLIAFNRYLELYPKGAHAKVADKKVIDLSVTNIFAGDHGSLPGMDRTSYSSSGNNTITVSNDTQYTLTLLYSGPDSKRLVLSPRTSGKVRSPNGTYRVAASVAAANVRSYAGTETLAGGGYDVSYYISTSRF